VKYVISVRHDAKPLYDWQAKIEAFLDVTVHGSTKRRMTIEVEDVTRIKDFCGDWASSNPWSPAKPRKGRVGHGS